MSLRRLAAHALGKMFDDRLRLPNPTTVISAPPSAVADYPAVAIWVERFKTALHNEDELEVDANGDLLVGSNAQLTPGAGPAQVAPGRYLSSVGTLRAEGRIFVGCRLPGLRAEVEDRITNLFTEDTTAIGRVLFDIPTPKVLGITLPWNWTAAAVVGDIEWSDEYAFAERLWGWTSFEMDVDVLAVRGDPRMSTLTLALQTDDRFTDFASAEPYTVDGATGDLTFAGTVTSGRSAAYAASRHGIFFLGDTNTLGNASSGMTADPEIQMVEWGASALADPPVFTKDASPRTLAPRTQSFGSKYGIGTWGLEMNAAKYSRSYYPTQTWFAAKFGIENVSVVDHLANPAWPTAGPAILDQFKTFVSDLVNEWIIGTSNINIVIMTGVADISKTYASQYAAYQTIVDSLRTTFPNCRIIIPRLGSKIDTKQNVRAAQEATASKYSNAETYRSTTLLSTNIVYPTNYNDSAYSNLGIYIANTLKKMMDGTTTPTAPWVECVGPIVTADNVSDITPELPPHQVDDILLVMLSSIGDTTHTLSSNPGGLWSEVTNSPSHAAGSTNPRLQIWWARADSANVSPPTIADVAGDDYKVVGTMVIRGAVNTGSPFDITGANQLTTINYTQINGVTTTKANDLLIAVSAVTIDSDLYKFGFPTRGGFDIDAPTRDVNVSSSLGTGHSLFVASSRLGTPGAADYIQSFFQGGSSSPSASMMLAISST